MAQLHTADSASETGRPEHRQERQHGAPSKASAPLTPELLVYQLVTPGDPQVSPDGASIVYTLHTADADTQRSSSRVWLCAIDGSAARALTPARERAGGARWSPDGRQIAYTQSAPPHGSGIFLLAAAHEDPPREATRHRGDIGDLAWSPDGRRLAYTATFDPDDPDEQGTVAPVHVTRRLDYKQDGRGFLGDVRQHVFVVDLDTGSRRRVTGEAVDYASPTWSPDGRWLLVHAPQRSEVAVGRLHADALLLLDPEAGESRAVTPPDCSVEQAAWSPTGDRVLFVGDSLPRSFQPDFFVHHVESGATRRLTDDHGAALPGGSSAPLVWLDDRRVLFHGVRAGASGLEVLDTETGAVETLWREECLHGGLSVDRARRRVVQVHSTLRSPPELWILDLATQSGRTITSFNRRLLDEHPPAQGEHFQVQRGGFTVDAWLLKPPDFDPAKRYPLVLDIHGGPASYYGYGFMAQQMAHQQCLATNGFLVVFANPRGSTSYGRAFAQAVDWGGEDYRDCMAAVDAVLTRGYADPERTGIYGYSYGGYLCAWTIGQTDRFQAAVCGSMFFDLESSYGTADNRGIAAHAGGTPLERPEWYVAHSPSTYAHQTRTPTLLIHGEEDQRIAVGQAEQMFVALKNAGCEVELALYPGASHMFLFFGPPEQRVDFLSRTLAWFQNHLGGPR